MLSSDADVSRSLPARRAFTVPTGPLANTPPAPSSSSVSSLPPPSPSLTTCFSCPLASTRFFSLPDSRLCLVDIAYPTFASVTLSLTTSLCYAGHPPVSHLESALLACN
eukprot:3086679-Pleurochrysis_carterae.AAC.1